MGWGVNRAYKWEKVKYNVLFATPDFVKAIKGNQSLTSKI